MTLEELQAYASIAKDLTLTTFLFIALIRSETRRNKLSDFIMQVVEKLLQVIETDVLKKD